MLRSKILYLKAKKLGQSLRLIFCIIDSSCINLLNNIINKNHVYGNSNIRRIAKKRVILLYL